MKIKLAQLNVSRDIKENARKVTATLHSANAGEWILFPEGMLTGYFPEDEAYLKELDSAAIEDALAEFTRIVKERGCFSLIGTARRLQGKWYNSVAIISPDQEMQFYDKIALSDLDKKHFSAGEFLTTYKIGGVVFRVQICRELVFPEQWQELKKQGAQIIFHNNNAIKPYDSVWSHILIARAVENQVFVASANNSSVPSELGSYLANPAGQVDLSIKPQQDAVAATGIEIVNFKSPY